MKLDEVVNRMDINRRDQETMERLQQECHEMVEALMTSKDNRSLFNFAKHSLTYQDATNVWLFIKLAQAQSRIEELEYKVARLEDPPQPYY
jgi:hypothetical protein